MAAKDDPKAVVERSIDEVQKKFDEINEKGYDGQTVDETPRENYTVGGVIAGKPTPETSDK